MEKKNIKKYVGAGLLAATLLTGLEIHDVNVDHTKEICPITSILNVIPNASYFTFDTYVPTGLMIHQWDAMTNDYNDKGIEDVTIAYGELTNDSEQKSYGFKSYYKDDDGFLEVKDTLKVKCIWQR